MADGPEGGQAYWVRAEDGVRIRVGGWQAGKEGTILLFNGRTEYIEKYGPTARAFSDEGLSTISVDWRGQGMADRVASDARLGHVPAFSDYQKDAAAFLAAAKALAYPEPYYLLGHSMGGAIGLRALIGGLPVRAAAFSAPMWGIALPALISPFRNAIVGSACAMGLGLAYAPATGPTPYPLKQAFDGNALTHDPDMYRFLQDHISAERRFGIGGPSITWLAEAFKETAALMTVPAVPVPALSFVGSEESVVDADNIVALTGRWSAGRVSRLEGARHEAMMEVPEIRAAFVAETSAHFRAA